MIILFATLGCSDVKDDPEHDHENELITTVLLEFTGDITGETTTSMWSDIEMSGMPVVDEIVLGLDESYLVSVLFLNELEEPAEDISPEIEAESDQHQIFFTGDSIGTLVEHSYLDSDENGLPLGLDNAFLPLEIGNGSLTVTLRHLPPENNQVVKSEDLADIAQTDGITALPGDSDAKVDFPIKVE
jgi:hypothetical protein